MSGQVKRCPYRKEHEWDKDGLCAHCYAAKPPDPHVCYFEGTSVNSAEVRCKCGAVRTFADMVVTSSHFILPAQWAPFWPGPGTKTGNQP